MRLLILVLLAGLTSIHGHAQPEPADPNVLVQLSIASEQREFHMGETIPLELKFSSLLKDHYQLDMAQYDRGGRLNYEEFIVSPASGAVDPLEGNVWGMGGLRSHNSDARTLDFQGEPERMGALYPAGRLSPGCRKRAHCCARYDKFTKPIAG